MDHCNQFGTDGQKVERRHARARSNRACAACRVRKQRCILPSTAGQTACQRCARHEMPCSFETEPADAHQEQPGPTKLAEMVVELQQRLNQHEARIAALEHADAPPRKYPRLTKGLSANASSAALSTGENQHAPPKQNHSPPLNQCFNSSMEQLELGAPIATLRSLGALSERRSSGNGGRQAETNNSSPDLIDTGVLTENEASRALRIYFDHCHPWAPVLSAKIQAMGIRLRETAPTLFLAIVAVGARFWQEDGPGNEPVFLGFHPQYPEIVKLLDANVSRLLLCSCTGDASLQTIQSLLIYLQWMPYDPCISPSTEGRDRIVFQTRYNEMSTWAVFGLALRYTGYCGLEQRVLGVFNDDFNSAAVTDEDLNNMRVWLNMVTYDCNLTLTSGLPASLDPRPMKARTYRFCSLPTAQQPGDVRYASMIELACIIQDVRYEKDNVAGKNRVLQVIAKANEDFDAWQRRWAERLGQTKLQQSQMPFTSVRWYRLALNSSLLRAVLSQALPEMLPLPSWAAQPLKVSLTAASQILLSVSKLSFQSIVTLESWSPSTFPVGTFQLNLDARKSLHHAVDSTWISYTFAITFLILCYLRKHIDDNLQLCGSSCSTFRYPVTTPAKPRQDSILYRLSRLALEIFSCSEQASPFRPDHGYTTLVQNATSLVLENTTGAGSTTVQPESISSIQAFFDSMEGPSWDWDISFSGEQAERDMES